MCYLYLFTTKENYQKFIELELFLKSMITRGHNKGKEKMYVLKNILIINFVFNVCFDLFCYEAITD